FLPLGVPSYAIGAKSDASHQKFPHSKHIIDEILDKGLERQFLRKLPFSPARRTLVRHRGEERRFSSKISSLKTYH
ncbi:MAG: hypothetical protein IJW48_04745, partial [Clostridia bacterium]|nr:hypothetical protein [Clostridia bacterium]